MKSNQLFWKRSLYRLGLAAGVALVCTLASADVLELKNGKVLTGKYAGGTATTINFETSAGVKTVNSSEALSLTFAGNAAAAAAPAATAPAAASAKVTVNAGTVLLVRLVDPVSSSDAQGKRFTTTLESDLVVDNTMVAKAGTKVYGRVQGSKEAGRYAGQSALDLRLSELSVGPNLVPIVTSSYTQAGEKSGRKAARGAAAGAAIGAAADGGDGAAKGAAIGAAASGVKKGEKVAIQPGTLLEFQLQQPLTVSVTP